jgi:hypothetical protein
MIFNPADTSIAINGAALVITATEGGWKEFRIQTGLVAEGTDFYWNSTNGFEPTAGETYIITINANVADGTGQIRFGGNVGASGISEASLTTTPTDFTFEYTQAAGNVRFDTGNTPTNEGVRINRIKIEVKP